MEREVTSVRLVDYAPWFTIASLAGYWLVMYSVGWDYVGYRSEPVYAFLPLVPVIMTQVFGLTLFVLSYLDRRFQFKMPNYLSAFIGNIVIIQFLLIGLFLGMFYLGESSFQNTFCSVYPHTPRCDLQAFAIRGVILILQNALWLPTGVLHLSASMRQNPLGRRVAKIWTSPRECSTQVSRTGYLQHTCDDGKDVQTNL